jgi:adenine-specific DNA-methyltransferase
VVREKTSDKRVADAKHRENAKRLRTNQTDAESVFWYNVRARRLAGFKFRRQYPVGSFIADFVCLEAKLIVELDGDQHAVRRDYDRSRDAFLKSKGFHVMRVWNSDLLTNRDGVMDAVLRQLENVDTPSPRPSPPKGERGNSN